MISPKTRSPFQFINLSVCLIDRKRERKPQKHSYRRLHDIRRNLWKSRTKTDQERSRKQEISSCDDNDCDEGRDYPIKKTIRVYAYNQGNNQCLQSMYDKRDRCPLSKTSYQVGYRRAKASRNESGYRPECITDERYRHITETDIASKRRRYSDCNCENGECRENKCECGEDCDCD